MLILVTLYAVSTDFIPLPPTALGKYNKADDHAGCFPPFSTITFLTSLSIRCRSLIGQRCVGIKYLNTGRAYWFDALTLLTSDSGLDHITESRLRYSLPVLLFDVFQDPEELIVALLLERLDNK